MLYITEKKFISKKPSVVTIGNFDGFHIGHQKLVFEVKEAKTKETKKLNNLSTIIFSFYPHPLKILVDENFKMLLTREEKKRLIEDSCIDVYYEYPFDAEFASLTPEIFINEILCKDLKCKILIVGEDFSLGKKKTDVYELNGICTKCGIELKVIKSELFMNKKISSTSIKTFLEQGKIEEANLLMGHPYFFTGKVEEGKQIGRTIGFPTANIVPNEEKILPLPGVYFSKVNINNETFNSVTNIGKNPTVSGNRFLIETNILNFDSDIYGKQITVELFHHTRSEVKFNSLDELKMQISKDKEGCKKYFGADKSI